MEEEARVEFIILRAHHCGSSAKMEPASLAFGVFAAFKDIYLTAKFIQKTAHTIKHFRSEQSGLIAHFNVQTIRLKNFSRLFRGEDGNVVDTRLLQTVPNVRRWPSSLNTETDGIFRNISKLSMMSLTSSNGSFRPTPNLPPI